MIINRNIKDVEVGNIVFVKDNWEGYSIAKIEEVQGTKLYGYWSMNVQNLPETIESFESINKMKKLMYQESSNGIDESRIPFDEIGIIDFDSIEQPSFDMSDIDFENQSNIKSRCCNSNLIQIACIDHFEELSEYGVPEKQIAAWLNKHDEGILFQCPVCGKFEYYSDSEMFAIEDPEEFEQCSKKLISVYQQKTKEFANILR